MLKLDILIVRRSDMTHEQFWNIGEIDTRRSLPASLSSRKLYVGMSRTVPDTPAGTFVAAFDGVAKLWFDDIDGFLEYLQSSNYKDVIRLDEEKFTGT